MHCVNKVRMVPQGPEFSQLVQGYWRLGSWHMTPQERLTFLKGHLELGISTVDTAAIYGDSEQLFGEALALDPAIRDRIQIISKFGINNITSSVGEKRVSHYDSSKSLILSSTERSLKRLGVEQLDALLIHRPDFLMDVDVIADTFSELKASGKVGHFGVSNFSPSQFALLQSRLEFPLITNQIEINPMNFKVLEDGTTDQLQRLRVSPMAWSCLAGGDVFSAVTDQARRLRGTLLELQIELGANSIEQVIFAWVLKHPANAVALIGTGKIERVRDTIGALKLNMNHEQWYRIWTASKGHGVA